MLVNKKLHNKYSIKGCKKFQFLQIGNFGIKTISYGRITEEKWKLIERDLQRKFKSILGHKKNRIWSSLEFNSTLTKLSLESRMGKGKGAIYAKSKFLKPGSLLFEFTKLPKQHENEIFIFIQKKLNVKLKLVKF
uniref:Ribosomal protein L16 n=1 Tax=Pterocladiella media TaxID=1911541 RepID=A0A1D8X7L9_9FLOR|nr:ribosomal protein L16 [Pterocladiella media]AOX49031.1 ribosomal protein L16 [Pterocladiella media]